MIAVFSSSDGVGGISCARQPCEGEEAGHASDATSAAFLWWLLCDVGVVCHGEIEEKPEMGTTARRVKSTTCIGLLFVVRRGPSPIRICFKLSTLFSFVRSSHECVQDYRRWRRRRAVTTRWRTELAQPGQWLRRKPSSRRHQRDCCVGHEACEALNTTISFLLALPS